MITGCYTLHLYCDTPGCERAGCVVDGNGQSRVPFEATAETGVECRKQARRRGWTLKLRTGTSWCPRCTSKRKAR